MPIVAAVIGDDNPTERATMSTVAEKRGLDLEASIVLCICYSCPLCYLCVPPLPARVQVRYVPTEMFWQPGPRKAATAARQDKIRL